MAASNVAVEAVRTVAARGLKFTDASKHCVMHSCSLEGIGYGRQNLTRQYVKWRSLMNGSTFFEQWAQEGSSTRRIDVACLQLLDESENLALQTTSGNQASASYHSSHTISSQSLYLPGDFRLLALRGFQSALVLSANLSEAIRAEVNVQRLLLVAAATKECQASCPRTAHIFQCSPRKSLLARTKGHEPPRCGRRRRT